MRQRKLRMKATLLLIALAAVVAGGFGLRYLSHGLVIENYSKHSISVSCGDFEPGSLASGEVRRYPRAVFGLSVECSIRHSGGDWKCGTPLGPGDSFRIKMQDGAMHCGWWEDWPVTR